MDQNTTDQTALSFPVGVPPFFFMPPIPPIGQMNQLTPFPGADVASIEQGASKDEPSQKMRKKNKAKEKKKNKNHPNKAPASTKSSDLHVGKENPLEFWDCSNDLGDIPSVEQIKKIHIYDFDNTLFSSPCPNPNLFNEQTIGMLTNSDMLHYGGWWAEPLIFKNAGEGWDVESKRQWESFWNGDVEDLLRLSYEQDDALAIIMTGRKSHLFTDLFKEILDIRGIKFNGLMLKKGNFPSTITYKTQVLTDILDYYENIEKVTIYDDRPSQLKGFQKCLNEYNEAVRPELIYNLVPVAPEVKYLEPKTERKIIEEIVEQHNEFVDQGKSTGKLGKVSLKQSFFYSGYMLEVESKAKVLEYILDKYDTTFTSDLQKKLKFLLGFIPIAKSKVSKALELELSSEPVIEWKITEFGSLNDEYFGLSVVPINSNVQVKTLFDPPFLSFATTKKSTVSGLEEFEKITDWEPIEDDIRIKTHFGQVVQFKIVTDNTRKRKRPAS